MRLQTRLLLALCITFFILFAGYEYWSYDKSLEHAEKDLQLGAERVRSVLMATRRTYHHQFIDSGLPLTPQTIGFLPAYALNRISKDFENWDDSGFSFNNVSDRPRNPNQKADQVELNAMEFFRNNPKEEVLFKAFQDSDGMSFYHYVRPIWIEEYCLKCHGKKLEAPPTIQKLYDTAFDYKVGDLRGILSIKVPASTVKERALAEFRSELFVTFFLFAILLSIIILTVRHYIGQPLNAIGRAMGEIADGNYDKRINGLQGEFASLGNAFNEMSEEITSKQDQLKTANEELLKAQKLESIGVLAGGIAHDFNNILTAIIGNIVIAKEFSKEEDELFEILSTAEKASMRARDLTQQLLTFSKGGAPIFKVTSVAEILRESANFALRGSTVKCRALIAEDLWNVEIDEGQISQVISNIIINAEQAMRDGGIVTISAENVHISFKDALPVQEGKYIKITIEDTGEGILEEVLPKIFDPYFSTKEKGSGLGLASSYSIITKHKGYITVESNVGVGTIFYIYLPASLKDVPVQKKEEERKKIVQGRILVLEDDEMITETVAMILRRAKYEAEFTSDGKETIEKYQKAMETGRPFDVVILDLTIPGGMGGEETIKKLREIDPYIKGIACSGYSNSPVMSDYQRYGFSGIMPKPFNGKELREILSKVLMERSYK